MAQEVSDGHTSVLHERKHLHEGMDLVAGKDPLGDIGVGLDEGPDLVDRGGLYNDETAGLSVKGPANSTFPALSKGVILSK
jgi:hypothetical protein